MNTNSAQGSASIDSESITRITANPGKAKRKTQVHKDRVHIRLKAMSQFQLRADN
jgi:hypothetical protein